MSDKNQFETVSNGLLVRAPAKINLSLLIAGKRPDGFHEIETVMAKVNFYDEILIGKRVASNGCGCDARLSQTDEFRQTSNATDTSRATDGRKTQTLKRDAHHNKSETSIELICKGPYSVPEGEENLVYKAAKLILDAAYQNIRESGNQETALKITLTKNIPAGSGLGSASSDAAATLMGLNRYLDLKLTNRQLAKLAPRLGSDVAFFLDGPLVLCKGKGEKIKKIQKIFDFLALLILPDVSVSTKRVYDNYRHNPALYDKLSNQINSYICKNRIDLVVNMCANMLLKSCFSLAKELIELKATIESFGIGPLCLSGSGSAMFCLVCSKDEEKVVTYKHNLQEKIGCKSIIVHNNRW